LVAGICAIGLAGDGKLATIKAAVSANRLKTIEAAMSKSLVAGCMNNSPFAFCAFAKRS
jgi:hypothetical protein